MNVVSGVPRIFHWGPRAKARRPRARWNFFGWGSTPAPPARGLGEPCEITSEVRGIAPTARTFSTISALRMASPDRLLLKRCGLSCSNWGGGAERGPPAFLHCCDADDYDDDDGRDRFGTLPTG